MKGCELDCFLIKLKKNNRFKIEIYRSSIRVNISRLFYLSIFILFSPKKLFSKALNKRLNCREVRNVNKKEREWNKVFYLHREIEYSQYLVKAENKFLPLIRTNITRSSNFCYSKKCYFCAYIVRFLGPMLFCIDNLRSCRSVFCRDCFSVSI